MTEATKRKNLLLRELMDLPHNDEVAWTWGDFELLDHANERVHGKIYEAENGKPYDPAKARQL